MKRLVIFDLDGTLLNSIADLAQSTNYALKLNGFPEHEQEKYKLFVGNGVTKLFERALPEGSKTEENIEKIRTAFVKHYDTHNTDLSTPYEGINNLLTTLHGKGIALAVASNKYDSATKKLIQYYFGNIPFVAVFGQREDIKVKPDPTIVEDIISIAKMAKDDVLYVGDSGVDMQTARNAGVTAVGVTWGFRQRAELEEFSPQYIINSANEILDIILD